MCLLFPMLSRIFKRNPLTDKGVALPVLMALSMSHLLNDLLQSVLSASYPLLKEDLALNFTQIGTITLVYQLAASVFQPIVGLFFDRHPVSWSLTLATTFTMMGIIGLAYAPTMPLILVSVFVIGLGSSVLHPEASRITSLASGGKRGFAQSLFQVGGNLGGSLGPLLLALWVAPYGRNYMVVFVLFAILSYIVARPIRAWFKTYLIRMKEQHTEMKIQHERPLSLGVTLFAIFILMILIFSKYIYMASLTSYYTFYLIEKFGVSVQLSQICLFVFLVATALGTLIGGPVGDRIGRKSVIWISILGTAPFSILMPHVGLWLTILLSFCVGLMLSSAFPSILLYAQELLPYRLGLVSGLFFGFAFGVAGIASAVLGGFADDYGIEMVYHSCAYMPLLGLVAWFLPELKKK